MTGHILIKRQMKSIADIKTFEDLISLAKISDLDRHILKYIYVEEQSVNFIADMLGYSAKTIQRRHAAALKKIEKIIK
jgi:DNA-directed RNA polymerase specialized sigma subunit